MAQIQKSFWKNTQNFFLTLGNADTRIIINLKHDLEDVQEGVGYQLTALHQTDINTIKKLLKALLNDANQLRINNRSDVSLRLIEAARNHGIISAKLEAERARALAALNHHEQAIQIWQDQASSDELKMKQQAYTEIRLYEQSHLSAIKLLENLQTTLRSEMVEIKHLPETAPHQLSALELPILNESIKLRNENNEQLSLKLLEICIQHGLRSDLIDDNKARALFKNGLKRDAIQTWQSLLSSNNEETRDSAQAVLTQQSQSLVAFLKKTIVDNQQQIRYIPEQIPQDLSKLGALILKEAIRLRKEDEAELSLQILELTTSAGFETDAINENRARALVNLKRNAEAVQILEDLLSSKKEETQESAKIILQNLSQHLLEQTKKILSINGWQIRHLPENPPQILAKLEPALLKEAIALREAKQEKLSIAILDLSIKSGLKTDRIDDNKARALFKNGLKRDAIQTWQSLLSSNNKETRDSAQAVLTQQSQSLVAFLKKTIVDNQQEIRYIPEQIPQDLSKLGALILKEAIRLRKEDEAELSLQILELTTSAGFETDAINANKARALVNLKRNTEAVQILEDLLSSKKEETQESAKRTLQNLSQHLLEQTKKILSINDWQILHLPENPPQILAKLEPALLKEAIALREAKQEQLSIAILDLSIKSGLKTDRIDDNKARALVNEKQYFEAVTIWNSLKGSKNAQIQQSAISMLKRFGDKGFQQGVLQEVDNILLSKKDKDQAVSLLIDAILQNPSNHRFHEKLGEVAIITKNKNDQSGRELDELTHHHQALAGFEAFITALEQRYKPALNGPDEGQALQS
jgi:hypothetical protein